MMKVKEYDEGSNEATALERTKFTSVTLKWKTTEDVVLQAIQSAFISSVWYRVQEWLLTILTQMLLTST